VVHETLPIELLRDAQGLQDPTLMPCVPDLPLLQHELCLPNVFHP
jgi:hypothetical protein